MSTSEEPGFDGRLLSERGAPGAPASDPAFDRWLTHYLGRLYDPVVHEPVPEFLVRLLEAKLSCR